MMLMADDNTSFWSGADIASGDDLESGGDEFTIGEEDFGLSIDLDSLFSILEEDPNPTQQNNPEDSSFRNVSQGDSTSNIGSHENFLFTKGLQNFEGPPPVGTDLPGPNTCFLSYNLEASDSRTGGSDCFLESDGNFHSGKVDLSGEIGSSVQMLHPERQYEIHNRSTAFTFAAGDVNHIPDYLGNADFCHRRGDFDSNYTSYGPVVQNSNISRRNHGISTENSMETFHAPEHNSCISTETSSQNASGSVPVCQAPETVCETSNCYPDLQYCGGMGDIAFVDSLRQYPSDNFSMPFIPTNEEMAINIKDEQEFSTGSVCISSEKISEAQFGKSSRHVPMMSATDYYDVKGLNYEHGNYISPFSGHSFSNVSDRPINARGLTEPLTRAQPCTSSLKQEACAKAERSDVLFTPNSSFEVMDEAVSKKLPGADDSLFTEKDRKKSLHYFRPSMSIHAKDEQEDVFLASERSPHFTTVLDEIVNNNPTDGECSAVHSAARHSSCFQQPALSKKWSVCIKDEKEGNLIHPKSIRPPLSNVSSESIQSNSSDQKSYVDDDADICILEDISIPPRSNASLSHGKSIVSSQRTASCGPLYHNGVGGVKLKANDERLIFRLALQDLSQPKLEANPPDGLLAVPLLRHQKIALSWMAQKETVNMFCSGGILADDQGLGKTISTIALILKERPPSSAICRNGIKHGESEMLNLDDDDANVLELDGIKCGDASVQARGRPAAGTLVVCPTSVLRQWAEELQNKVTSKANLSVLVYHGSNRTKDPCELAKYDVVLTTYSIVSMEVPKQPLVDKDDDERRKRETNVTPTMGLNSSRKRKFPPSSGKGGSNHKKGADIAFLESAARPLARVVWFRVVLDEAQSIKNHRTQVARACWGLRAKRRWCLSGTPIQNAVDDLYSYFRFLKYDPYAVYKTFCSTIKVPINRNPANGYRKLQAVLRTIMLRRTKGTLLDGEPIITLPPKFVELKKVDFSKEERHFYSRLEADSRAQFEEYAAAGTVKQNYVNILLMLLRLRQACDHPLLVRGYNSNSVWRSSVETAKKLPLEKQNNLLTCLEASLAICGICNDPPEDAVVSVCGHVFCNQCICEHLTGDDSQCPNGNCKVQLSVSSVFSKLTLKSSLADQSVLDGSPDSSGSELVNALDPGGLSCDSSKIKAALEVLQSLSKPQNCMASSSLKSLDETASYLEETTNLNSGGVDRDISRERNTVVDKDLKDPIKLVGEKAIVFSQWTRMLDLLEACLKNSSIQYRRLDGTMSVVARDKAVKDFNTLPEVSVMIMSLKAASLGLNMVAACHVVLLDLWWNPTTEDQAIDRAHRIGQTRAVTVLRLTVKDTVEDRILALQQKKREMVASAFGEDESGSLQTRLTVEDLKYLFMV